MNSLIGARACHSRSLCMHRRPIHWAHSSVIAILVATVCFACTATIVSGFLSHYSVSLLSQHEVITQQEKSRRTTRPQAVDDNRVDEDQDFITPELNDIMSRRRTLATLAVSTTAFLSTSPSALAKQSNTVQNDPKVVRNTPIITMDTVKSTSKSIELSKAKSPEPSSFQESVSGFVAGASVSVTKTLIKFPLDTATVRVQMPNSQYSIRDPFGLFKGCFNGISLTLLLNIPAGAVFFSVKDAVKTAIKSSDGSIANMPVWLRTSFAVLLALPPYWLVRNPSEVVKVRQQANIDGYGGDVSAIDAIKQTFKSDSKDDGEGNNASDFYTGYRENVLYAFPADVIKFVAYESITKGRKDISPFEGAGAGAVATALAQLVTTPLDVVRNRLMTGKNGDGSSLSLEEKNKGYIGSLITLGKEEGLSGLFAGTIPRVSKAVLSGAIQFATYEETKQSMSKILLRR